MCLVMSAVGCSQDFTWGEGRSKKEGGSSTSIMPLQLQVAFCCALPKGSCCWFIGIGESFTKSLTTKKLSLCTELKKKKKCKPYHLCQIFYLPVRKWNKLGYLCTKLFYPYPPFDHLTEFMLKPMSKCFLQYVSWHDIHQLCNVK